MLAHAAFLRVSNQASEAGLDIAVVSSGEPPPLPCGPELRDIADAVTTQWTKEPAAEREALVAAAGPAVAERAIGVTATFQMMNRLLDGVGAPIREQLHETAIALGFEPNDIPR